MSETDKFFDKYDKEPEFEKATQELLIFVLKTIGEDHGAKDILFNRNENEVKGLPSKGVIKIQEIRYFFPRFPLRLYALKIRENIVILFNGGIKDEETNQKSSLNMKWREACAFAKKIDKAMIEKDIIVDEESRRLYWYDSSEEIIL
jgi:hypothetical protein